MELVLRNHLLLYYHSLSDLGHNVIVSYNDFRPEMFNIIYHPLAVVKNNLFEELAKSGIPYGIQSTEIFTGTGYCFDQWVLDEREMDFLKRFLNGAKFVWTFFREEYECYKTITDNVQYVPWGYHDKMQEIPYKSEKLVDVLFFGSITAERQAVIDKLRSGGLNAIILPTGISVLTRNSYIALSRINLHLHFGPPYTHTSASRVAYLANNRICSVTNLAVDPDGYLDYAVSYPEEDLTNACCEWIASGRGLAEGDRVYEALRAHPMRDILARALDEANM